MKNKRLTNVFRFFAAVYAASAVLYLPILLSGRGMFLPLNKLFMVLITFVPSITGVIFVYRTRTRDERRDFWRRVLRWPAGNTKQALAYLLIFPATVILSVVLSSLLSGTPVPLSYGLSLFRNWKLLIQFLLVEIFLGAVSEELGWRGFALDELQSRFSPLASGLILGVFWSVWHTPAFLIPGLSQHEMGGVFSLPFFSFLITPITASIIHTHAYNATNRSILVAGILMHFSSNATMVFFGGIFDSFSVSYLFWYIQPLLSLSAAVVTTLVSLSRGRTAVSQPAKGFRALRTRYRTAALPGKNISQPR